ncbi:MAG TPA: SDR family NAD(P)-dependent oxidoreductase [Microvirga sp.]|jgi:NAD(P)-dependent dehydrogenase (short-subunit alcohol dehydrogenase family)|nr:SDR family NAD(P)-dependent oxidoreductase [Microvirga sp.]
MIDLSNRVIVVTGAAGNLGRAIGRRLHAAGAARVLLDRAGLQADEERTLAVGEVDLTDGAQVSAALERAKTRFGRIDGLVATVGGFEGGPAVHETPWSAWERMLNANLKTAVTACHAVLPHFVEGGRIVTIGARPGVSSVAGLAPYAASKAAVIRLTESIALEHRDRNITANCIAPSTIDTPQNRAAMPGANFFNWVPPDEIAELALFLLSPAARSISGAVIPIYGRA